MCRKEQLLSLMSIILGAGYIISSLFTSAVIRILIGIVLVVIGILSNQK